MKRVISFRLSTQDIAALDEVCAQLGLNRSQAVAKGIAVLASEYVKTADGIVRQTPWLKTNEKP